MPKHTDYGEIADTRINVLLDFSEIHSKDDYIRAVKKILNETPDVWGNLRGKNLLSAVEELYDQSSAKTKIEENKLKKAEEESLAFREAQSFERRRRLKERLRDESRTAKNTRPATRASVRIWKRRPTRMDIRGVDTNIRRRGTITLLSKSKLTELRGKGIAVTYDKRGFRHFRNMKTGRFTKA